MATDYKVGQILAMLQRLTLREDQADKLIQVIIERLEDPKPKKIPPCRPADQSADTPR
jgi:hypothetical protein